MNKRRFQRAVLLTGFACLLLGGGYGYWLLQTQRHQYALNRQLIAALVKYDTAQARSLVNEGADPSLPDRKGNTPLHFAQQYHLSDIMALLQQHGATK